MSSTPKVITFSVYVVQCQFAHGPEWEQWFDMPGSGDEDVYTAIGKAELFHYFMEHGTYPPSHADSPLVKRILPMLQAVHASVVADQRRNKFKSRTRVVKRTAVSHITDEEVDTAMAVKHGREGQ